MKFEGAKPSLKPWEFFVISIFLVFIVALTLVVAYYNMFLAYRNRPPFKVCKICPQVLFPRGERGLGKHNVEEE